VLAAVHTTGTLAGVTDDEPYVDVVRPGVMTTVQDWPGRLGFWDVGISPSGPMDDLSFRLGNRALGNPEGAPGLECTVSGPAFRVSSPTRICVTGADVEVLVDGVAVPTWMPVDVPAGSTVDVGTAGPLGLRSYLLFAGGLDVPDYLGSAATFTLGQFGGHGGRAIRTGDVLRTKPVAVSDVPGRPVPLADRPQLTGSWTLAVQEGPHAAPDFFTAEDIADFYAASFEVHFNSSRTGVRLTLTTTPTEAVLWIDNDGPPVPEGDRDRIFERFVRLDEARTRDHGGSGLGLAITRATMQAHHGDAAVVDGPAGWCRFELRLPRVTQIGLPVQTPLPR
jgi:urea carboxylase